MSAVVGRNPPNIRYLFSEVLRGNVNIIMKILQTDRHKPHSEHLVLLVTVQQSYITEISRILLKEEDLFGDCLVWLFGLMNYNKWTKFLLVTF